MINSSKKTAEKFLSLVLSKKPKEAVICSSGLEEIEYREFTDFSILFLQDNNSTKTLLTPDFAICKDCENEINDSKNRRYKYAFTTCVNCGPRYSITKKFPFERINTSLATFTMCEHCSEEYKDPSNRRFHSQTNSCPHCGISLSLEDSDCNSIESDQKKVITKTIELIKNGHIIAIKNPNGYMICCDAKRSDAIQKLREKKHRPFKPFAVLYPSISMIKQEFLVASVEENDLKSSVAPIVILKNTEKTSIQVNDIAPGLNCTGVMLPSTPLLKLLMDCGQTPIVATSANLSGSPIIDSKEVAIKKLKETADYFVHHNLDIVFPQDDSVVKFAKKNRLVFRRSRGLSPNFTDIEISCKTPIIATGADLKSTFTCLSNQNIYVSQYFGDLENYEVFERYKNTYHKLESILQFKPKIILVDSHPTFQSTLFGNELLVDNNQLISVQHHKAHFSSVLGEHNLFKSSDKVLGIIWDGAGYGDDSNVWGGEFFVYQKNEITRVAHFDYFKWLAKNKMALEPRLSLLSLLDDNTDLIRDKFSRDELNLYKNLKAKEHLQTSSVGRIFDAVSSLLDLKDINSYEGEAAMALEQLAGEYNGRKFLKFIDYDSNMLSSKTIISNILEAYNEGHSKEKIAASFIYTLADICVQMAKRNNVSIIACSGGVFQNCILVKMLLYLATKENVKLAINRKLACNDENISFGQMMYHLNIQNKYN